MTKTNRSFFILFFSLLAFLIFLYTAYFHGVVYAQNNVSANTETGWGLHTTTFSTPNGKIMVNLPDDMAAGDTISGTVIAEPSGSTHAEREENMDELRGYVVELKATGIAGDKTIAKKPVDTSEKKGKVSKISTIAAVAISAAPMAIALVDGKGGSVSETGVPVNPNPPVTYHPAVPTPDDYQLPGVGQAGRPLVVTGPFDGNTGNTTVKVGGNDVNVLAESPRKVVAKSPKDIVGPTTVQVTEGDVTAMGQMNNLAINLYATKTILLRGESATLGVKVSGLNDIKKPVYLNLTNETPQVVSIAGGDFQTITILPDQASSEGVFYTEKGLTGIQPGGFDIVAQAQDEKCKQIIVEEKIEWGEWHREQDSTRWREGTVYKVEKCADPGGPHPEKKTEIGKAKEVKKGSRWTVTKDKPLSEGGNVVTEEKKDSRGRTTSSTTAEYDGEGNVTNVTKKDKKGNVTEEWKKEGDDWYKKRRDEWSKRSSGPRDVPEKLEN